MTYLAEAKCRASGWAFPETFRNQYLIAPASDPVPEGWQSRIVGKDWRVSHCPNLPVCELALSNGDVVGLIVGHAIGEDGLMLEHRHKLTVNVRAADRVGKVEAFISGLAGRFVALVAMGKTARVYPDPVCGMGPVYHPQSRRLGTSLTLVLDREVEDNPHVPLAAVQAGRARYLFGHTPDAEVLRARSNHYIDLADFSLHRHWPTEGSLLAGAPPSPREVAAEIGEKLGANMLALASSHRTALPITGGTDSRLLLSAAAGFLDRIDQFFVYRTNWANSIDVELALEIAQIMCLPLRVISDDAPQFHDQFTPYEFRQLMRRRYLRGGLEPDSSERGSVKAMAMLPADLMILRGNVAEMTRALRWHKSVFDDPHNTGFALAKLEIYRDRVDGYDFYESAFLDWKAGLPDFAVPRIYDFLHSELWVPHTNSTVYMREPSQVFINPFADRRLIELTTAVPPAQRRRMRLVNAMIGSLAMDLRDLDYKSQRARSLVADQAS